MTAKRRVVYLLGAGASHACADYRHCGPGILMRDLTAEIAEGVRQKASSYSGAPSIVRFVNDGFNDGTDIEHVITFFEESGSAQHKKFAHDLRSVFEDTLRRRLSKIQEDLGAPPTDLYAALIDMHEVSGCEEAISGILTLNYDGLLEYALEVQHQYSVNYGPFEIQGPSAEKSLTVLKLHGSFDWPHSWPTRRDLSASPPLWIPPGIQKAKRDYPFNLIWGLAKRLLDCDVVRVIGCNLGANDWDLISMLFSGQHTNDDRSDQAIEIIDRPKAARRIRESFPYLRTKTLFDLEDVGEQVVAEMLDREPVRFDELEEPQQDLAFERGDERVSNPFYYWLKQRAEAMSSRVDVGTSKGFFRQILENPS